MSRGLNGDLYMFWREEAVLVKVEVFGFHMYQRAWFCINYLMVSKLPKRD